MKTPVLTNPLCVKDLATLSAGQKRGPIDFLRVADSAAVWKVLKKKEMHENVCMRRPPRIYVLQSQHGIARISNALHIFLTRHRATHTTLVSYTPTKIKESYDRKVKPNAANTDAERAKEVAGADAARIANTSVESIIFSK